MTYTNPIFTFLFLSLSLLPLIQTKLTTNYYQTSCPKFSDIVRKTVTDKQNSVPTTAGATVRLFYHDCMVGGCDASILIASCADNLATVGRDLVVVSGGPSFEVPLGRKDSIDSKGSNTENQFPLPTMTISQVIQIFKPKGFSIQEMVALVGANTIGYFHCNQFSNRLFHFSKNSETDPAYNPEYAAGLRSCVRITQRTLLYMSAFNDVITPAKFDNMYYKNSRKGLGLLATDSASFADSRTKPFVDMYANDGTKFFKDFTHAIEKLGVLEVKTGNGGEVRHRCNSFNIAWSMS